MISAKALEWTDVPFSVQVPKDAAYGYYLAITFAQNNSNSPSLTGAKLTGVAAVPILLDVKKEGAKADAKIVDFSTKNYVNEYLPVDFNVTVEDNGNIHVVTHGNIFISDGGNKNLASLDINDTAGNIIPGTKRSFTASWDDGFLVNKPILIDGQPVLDKSGQPKKHLTINWDKLTSFRIGKYTANLILVFDNGTRDVSLESTISFWVFPWKALLIIIIIVVVVALILRYILKAYIQKQVKKSLKE